jgi:hypothetical protein
MEKRANLLTRCLPEWACPYLAGLLILIVAAGHLVWLALDCPLDLAPDEAHYWDWSRHIDWSYYSKGPLVAWLIRASCELVGGWSERYTGNLMFAIRLPAVVCGSLLLASLYLLTVQVFARPRLALAVVLAALTFPLLATGSTLMTIDSPYTCCWGWALVLGHRAVTGKSLWAWEATGLAVGLGILAKYNMAAFVPSLALFLLTSPDRRRLLISSGFWSMVGIALISALPILVWNAQHEWVTVRHLMGLAGVADKPARSFSFGRLHWWGPAVYVGMQAGMLFGYWFFAWLCAMVVFNPLRRQLDAGVRYLWWQSAPMFLLFLAFSLKTGGGEPNWPVAAYISGGVLAAGWLATQLQARSGGYRVSVVAAIVLTCLAGVAVTAVAHHSEKIHPLLERVTGPPTPQQPYPVRRFDPTCRLRGWRTLAAAVDQVRAELRAKGVEPVLAAYSWSVPGELGVYCSGHPQAYSIGLMQGDRHSQYDHWTNPINQPEYFDGRTFLIVGPIRDSVRNAFDHVEPPRLVTHYQNGRPLAGWLIYVCKGFHRFKEPPPDPSH